MTLNDHSRKRTHKGRGLVALAASSALVLSLALAVPGASQESILPPGFEQPRPQAPAPAPRPAPSPRPTPAPAPRPATPAPAPRPATPTPAPRPVTPAPTAPAPGPVAPSPGGPRLVPAPPLPQGTSPATPQPASGADAEATPATLPRYDLPPGSRRLLTRIGPLTPETGGLAPTAYGNRGGRWLSLLMRGVRRPLVSRWGHILVRRSLLSAVDTPSTINGADLAAARALLLLRLGEARPARMIIQSVDTSRASPALRTAALQTYLANADPAGMCPHVPAMVYAPGHDRVWELAQAMCNALEGESGSASALIERARRRGIAPAIDVTLAEKVVGAGFDGRRSTRIEWDNVDRLTPWRFGLATSTGVTIPDQLWTTATPAMRGWAVQATMIPVMQRMDFAADAARTGILSSRSYVNMLSWAASLDEVAADVDDQGIQLRSAFVAASGADRVNAIKALSPVSAEDRGYAGLVLTARAAARIRPGARDAGDVAHLLRAMFAGGLDRNAMAWVPEVRVGSAAWGLLAVGSPRPLSGVDADAIDDFSGSDDSADGIRTRFLAAALIGLGRMRQGDSAAVQADLELGLDRQTRWTRAIDAAAARGEPGTVALLAAVGMQADSWAELPPYHLYHIVAALNRVGLSAEARMIAAEALSRV